MFDLIIILGAITLVLLIMTLIFQMFFRKERKKIYYKLHRNFAIVTIFLAAIHGIIAILYFFDLI